MNERPACRLTDAVHLSHFEDKTLKVLRSSTYSLLTSRTRRPPKKNAPCFPDLRAPDFLFKKERAFFLRCSALAASGRAVLDRAYVGVLGYWGHFVPLQRGFCSIVRCLELLYKSGSRQRTKPSTPKKLCKPQRNRQLSPIHSRTSTPSTPPRQASRRGTTPTTTHSSRMRRCR